jgi:hypothetical protein
MKRVWIAIAVFCAVTPPVTGQTTAINNSHSNIKNLVVAVGPDGKAHCTASGSACTKDDVARLNAAIAGANAGPAGTARIGIKGVSLAPDGSLACAGKDDKQQPCTAANAAELNKAAAATQSVGDPVAGAAVAPGAKSISGSK